MSRKPPSPAGIGTAVPRGFGTGVHEMPAASTPLLAEDVRKDAARSLAVRDRYRQAMGQKGPPGPKEQEAPDLQREQERKAALLSALKERRPGAGPALEASTVRSDYFATYEHKAAGELLTDILHGKDPFREPVKSDSHVLFQAKDGVTLKLGDPVPLSALHVASADPSWQADYLRELREVIAVYQPARDLQVNDTVTLHYGEIIGLAGDYYDSPQQLHDELTDDVAVEIRHVSATSTGTGLLTLNRGVDEYLGLALKNVDHFTPYNWVRYCRHHCEALLLALSRDLDGALLRNAFADHFLTDAFAAGHIRTPRLELMGVGGSLDARAQHDEDNEHGVWVQTEAGYVWRAYGDEHLGVNPIHLLMTSIALGRSLQRIYRAFRMEGDNRTVLGDLAKKGLSALPQTKEAISRIPSDLPEVLGPCGGLALPSIIRSLPVPLPSAPSPAPQALVNYPPLFVITSAGKTLRQQVPDYDRFFQFGAGQVG